MKLSIITINFNNFKGLQKTAESVIAQSWRTFEWIIIDGGSNDGSKDYIQSLASRSSNNISFWCSEPDNGVYNAMNKGIVKARGEYLNFLNSGDSYNSVDALQSVMQSELLGDIIYGDYVSVKNDKKRIVHLESSLSLKTLFQQSIGHPSSFIKASLLKGIGYNENYKIVSDWERFLQWYAEGRSFVHIDGAFVDFDASGISSTRGDISKKERHDILIAFISKYPELFINEMNCILDQLKEYDTPEFKEVKRLLDRGHIRYHCVSFFCSLTKMVDKLISQYR